MMFLFKSDAVYSYFRYYEYHGMYTKASNYIYNLAHSEDPHLIEQRLLFLRQAQSSATRACGLKDSDMSQIIGDVDTTAYMEFTRELKDEIVIAGNW